MEIFHYSFMLNERRLCVWGTRREEEVDHFLKSIDPGYFEHLAEMHGAQLEGDQRRYAATALRVAYSHGLETLFALLGATIQAPHHPLAWMVRYTNDDLREVVRKIEQYEAFPTKLSKAPASVTWHKIAQLIFQLNADEATKEWIHKAYARLWKRFAKDFLGELFEPEYNSIKHGLRVTMHGTHLWMGVESEPGVPAPPEAMRYMGGSEFGTSFYETEKLHDKHNFRLMNRSQNWNPEKFAAALPLISNCINNIIYFLKYANGLDTSEMGYIIPEEEKYFDAPWEHRVQGMSLNGMNTIINPDWIKPLTSQEIEAEYFAANEARMPRLVITQEP